MGLTPTLAAASRVILIVMMYMGRVGVLTLALPFSCAAESRQGSNTRTQMCLLVEAAFRNYIFGILRDDALW